MQKKGSAFGKTHYLQHIRNEPIPNTVICHTNNLRYLDPFGKLFIAVGFITNSFPLRS